MLNFFNLVLLVSDILERIVNKIINLDVNEIENFDFPLDEVFGIETLVDGIKYEFIAKFSSSSDGLICFGSGAADKVGPNAIEPPIFHRFSWHKSFDESVLFYNDPTRYLGDLKVGWCIGDRNIWYLEVITDIIGFISENLSINSKHILFYGSSAGGFNSIQLGTLIRGSLVLINNSQLILPNYVNHIFEKVLKTCFGDMNRENIFNNYGYRLNVLELFEKMKYIPPIIYHVNMLSKMDITRQCIPFIEGLKNLNFSNEIEMVEINFHASHSGNNNHNPLNKETTIKLIKFALKNKVYYNKEYHLENIERRTEHGFRNHIFYKYIKKFMYIMIKIFKNK